GRGTELPDADTAFYVTYYDEGGAAASPLSDRFVGSVTRILAESVAREVALLQRQVDALYRSGFVDTASGDALDQVVALLGLTRRGGDFATGAVVFRRAPGAAGDITVPAGTQITNARPPLKVFETQGEATLRDGQLSVTVAVRATSPGAAGVAAAGELTVMTRPVAGVEAVTNPEASAAGSPTESDDDLRARAKRAVGHGATATLDALAAAVQAVPGVRSARVADDPATEPGVVRLAVDAGPEATGAVLAAIEAARPAGVRVRHNLEGGGTGQPALTEVRLTLALWLELADPLLPQERTAPLLNRTRDAVTAYVDGLGVGGTLSLNKIVSLALAVEGVENVADVQVSTTPARPIAAASRGVALAPDERFVLAAPPLVERAGAAVWLDVAVALDAPPPDAPRRARQAIEQRLGAGGTLSPDVLRAALTGAGLTVDSLRLGVEYEASGAVFGDVPADQAVAVQAHEQARLRTLTVDGGGEGGG
ncbi:MAG TPA: baseplate J/gp47 family protein, partial [Chloroflexota bacterium]|nr:baseplate J/gp47 family protein [Chloroflexota bacterium]